jgi:hypothetical protein
MIPTDIRIREPATRVDATRVTPGSVSGSAHPVLGPTRGIGGGEYVKPNIKAIEPTKYNGRQDLDVFKHFVEQSVEYLIDGQLLPDRHASKIGLFLEGTAKMFFEGVVKSPEEWSAEQVIRQLFDFCFKDGFMSEVRRKFNTWQQQQNSVRIYAATMEGLRADLGDEVAERRFIQRVWEGLNDNISARLYLDRKHPETSTYDEVLESALVAERAINNNIHRDQSTASSKRQNQPAGATNGSSNTGPKRTCTNTPRKDNQASNPSGSKGGDQEKKPSD